MGSQRVRHDWSDLAHMHTPMRMQKNWGGPSMLSISKGKNPTTFRNFSWSGIWSVESEGKTGIGLLSLWKETSKRNFFLSFCLVNMRTWSLQLYLQTFHKKGKGHWFQKSQFITLTSRVEWTNLVVGTLVMWDYRPLVFKSLRGGYSITCSHSFILLQSGLVALQAVVQL